MSASAQRRKIIGDHQSPDMRRGAVAAAVVGLVGFAGLCVCQQVEGRRQRAQIKLDENEKVGVPFCVHLDRPSGDFGRMAQELPRLHLDGFRFACDDHHHVMPRRTLGADIGCVAQGVQLRYREQLAKRARLLGGKFLHHRSIVAAA